MSVIAPRSLSLCNVTDSSNTMWIYDIVNGDSCLVHESSERASDVGDVPSPPPVSSLLRVTSILITGDW